MAKILIVDDEISIKITFSKFLSNEGHEVYAADNVDQAFEYILKNDLDLIISDIVMPRYSGLDLTAKLRSMKPDTPIIIMTGEPSLDTALSALRLQISDYLIKPISKDLLLDTVSRILEKKKLIDERAKFEQENLYYREKLTSIVESRTESLKAALKAAIKTICSIHEQRDSHTPGHQRRVGNLAIKIAEKMNLASHMIDGIGISGYLHDIGNVLVPVEILQKPELISDEERKTMQKHVDYGYAILKNIELPWPVADTIYKHHERLDGSGYPRGLKAEDIDTAPRILAVADVIESTLSPRPHRSAMDLNTVLYKLEEGKGRIFDENVVNAAIKLLVSDGFELDESTISIDFDSISW